MRTIKTKLFTRNHFESYTPSENYKETDGINGTKQRRRKSYLYGVILSSPIFCVKVNIHKHPHSADNAQKTAALPSNENRSDYTNFLFLSVLVLNMTLGNY